MEDFGILLLLLLLLVGEAEQVQAPKLLITPSWFFKPWEQWSTSSNKVSGSVRRMLAPGLPDSQLCASPTLRPGAVSCSYRSLRNSTFTFLLYQPFQYLYDHFPVFKSPLLEIVTMSSAMQG